MCMSRVGTILGRVFRGNLIEKIPFEQKLKGGE